MNKKFLAAGMAAAMAATMLPSMAFADEQPTVTLLVPEYNAGKSRVMEEFRHGEDCAEHQCAGRILRLPGRGDAFAGGAAARAE